MATRLVSAASSRFLAVSKYLLPLAPGAYLHRGTAAPRETCSVFELPYELPGQAALRALSPGEPAGTSGCWAYGRGRRQWLEWPTRERLPEYVARICGGVAAGRHCIAIDPRGRMIRESGFFLVGDAAERRCAAPWRARRHQREMDLTLRSRIPQSVPLPGTAAALNLRCSHNFFHWMLEVLPRLSLLRSAGWSADWYLIDCLAPSQRLVLEALGVGADQVRQPHCRATFVPETLLLPSLPAVPAMRQMAADLVRGLGVRAATKPDLQLYISRRKARTRRLVREETLEAALAARGFEVHCLEDYPLARQLELTSAARTIVASHGAGLAHLAFAPPGADVVEIVPDDRYNLGLYPELSRRLGHRHRLVLAEREGSGRLWRAETADVLAAIDELAEPVAANAGAARAAA